MTARKRRRISNRMKDDAGRTQGMTKRASENSVRFHTGGSEWSQCRNPLCRGPLPTRVRKPRQFCSDQCKNDGSILRRAARLLARLGQVRAWEILRELNGTGDTKLAGTIGGKG